ncbi:MAG: hypothetical protein DCE90_00245 [Pseudanabaena sp.]|nr:MAG: hypothetical protein DCE90_00245 [Pseudanabaena sp.]
MTLTKLSDQVSKRRTLTFKTVCLNAIYAGAFCFASTTGFLIVPSSPVLAQFGLGLPRSAGTGGATRGNLPQITMLVPEDGARTLSTRPTLYWYIAPPSSTSSSSGTPVSAGTAKSAYKITFFLRDGYDKSAKPVFIAEGTAEKSGLYKFQIPETAPELAKGKVQRWQIRWQTDGGVSQVDVNAPILLDEKPKVLKEIASAKNDLEKARIYAKNAYWYDALDAYTLWLTKNPQDQTAKSERNNLLKEGFKTHTAFSWEQEGNITKLLSKLDESAAPISINLVPRVRR